jgi:hypothetical protein
MPYKLIKLSNGKYRVVNALTGKIHARATSRQRAVAQIRIMRRAEKGY